MGCCMGRDIASLPDSDEEPPIALGKGRPLLRHRIKWRSESPLSESQLQRKREEFWETAPCFEGRKEIWDALRAAAAHADKQDWALAQAILDGANISLPDGTLRESYDELGSRYQVPVYCLSPPQNLSDDSSRRSSTEQSTGQLNGKDNNNSKPGQPLTLRLRLSTTGEEIKMDVRTNDLVRHTKRRLHETVAEVPDYNLQRWYFGGRMLADKMTIEQCRIPAHFVVQVVLREATPPENGLVEKPTSSCSTQETIPLVLVKTEEPKPRQTQSAPKKKSHSAPKTRKGKNCPPDPATH